MENDKKEEEKKKIKYIYILFLNLLVPGRRPAIRSQASGWRRWHSLSHTDQTVNHDFKIAALLRTLQTSLVIWPVSSGYYTGLSVIFNNVNEKALARASPQCNCKCNHSNILPSTLFSKITSYFPSEHQAEHFQIATRGERRSHWVGKRWSTQSWWKSPSHGKCSSLLLSQAVRDDRARLLHASRGRAVFWFL